MKRTLILLTLILLFGSCKKERTIDFSGKVYDPVSGNSIAGVKLELIEQQGPSLTDPLQSASEPVATIVTDESGGFDFNYLGKSRFDYYVLVTYDSEENKMIGWENGGTAIKDIKKGEVEVDNLRLIPKADFRLTIKNINCENSLDSLFISVTYLENFDFFGASGSRIYTGCYDDTFETVPVSGTRQYTWMIKRNSGISHGDTIIEIVPGQMNVFEFHY